MKGPAVFVVSLIGVAVLGVLSLRPILAERERLASRIRAPGDSLPPGEERGRALAARLAEFLPPAPGPALDAVLEGLGARVSTSRDSRGVVLDLPWERLPELLRRLCTPGAPPVVEVSAASAGEPPHCRVRLVFPPPLDAGVPR